MSEETKKETPKKKPSSMWQRIVTGACLIAVLTLVLCLGGWYFAVAVFLATMLAIHEELNALKVGGHRPVCWTSYVALCLAVPAMRFYSSLAIIPILTVLGFFVVLQVMRREDPDLIDILVSVLPMITLVLPCMCLIGLLDSPASLQKMLLVMVFAVAFASRLRVKIDRVGAGFFFAFIISYCLSSVVRVGNLELRDSYVFLPILLPFVVDAGAMFVGMFLGKHPFAPVLSPKKTVEGSVGGLIVGVGITLLYGLVFHFITDVEVNYYFLAVYGILGGVITEVGDLAFSYVKRNRKIKDFGHILPGHGGVLDRFDSVIFCAPLIELLIQWLPAFSKGAGA